jgi:signal transduction histidine kinase
MSPPRLASEARCASVHPSAAHKDLFVMTAPIPTDARVLVVDDNPARGAATAAALAPLGVPVRSAASLDEAADALHEGAVALAIVEARVGDGAARDLIQRLRSAAGQALPTIVLDDAPADGEALLRLAGAGAVDRLQRPFAPEALALKVAFVLGLAAAAPQVGGADDRAAQLLRLNELMVAGLIHDLRTPLMAINLSAEVALARTSEDAVRQAARRIRTSSQRMSRIFDHLLNLSRVSPGVERLTLARADLREVTQAALDAARRIEPAARFEVTEQGEFDGVFDAALIGRTIEQLVVTALAHVGPGDPVTLQLDGQHRDRLVLAVSIANVIPAEAQERLFVPGPKTAGREVPGLGLGLHEVDAYVRAHGGSVVGRSRTPEGTLFELLLPRDAAGRV